jgi:hypothetical protein
VTYGLLSLVQTFSQKCAEIIKHALLMLSVLGSTHHCEQLLSLTVNVKSVSRMHIDR